MRLQKYLSSCGIASRRKSEELIKNGLIKVNDVIINQMGFIVTPFDKVEFNGKIIKPSNKIYIILNKPKNFVCSRIDLLKRPLIYDIVDDEQNSVFSVGRLDYESSGLIILTNDGDFANELSHPSKGVNKTYLVNSDKMIPDKLVKSFKEGLTINDIQYRAVDVHLLNKNQVKIVLHEGKKREIREVFKYFDVKIIKLERISIGNLNLGGLKINSGEFIYANLKELKELIYEK